MLYWGKLNPYTQILKLPWINLPGAHTSLIFCSVSDDWKQSYGTATCGHAAVLAAVRTATCCPPGNEKYDILSSAIVKQMVSQYKNIWSFIYVWTIILWNDSSYIFEMLFN